MGTLFIIWVKGNHIYHLNMNACCVPYSWKTVYIPTLRPTSCIMSKNYLTKSLHSSSGTFQRVKNVFKRMTLNYVQFLLSFYKYLKDKDIQNLKKSYENPLMNMLISIPFIHIFNINTIDHMEVNFFEHLEIVIFSWDLVTSFEFKQF